VSFWDASALVPLLVGHGRDGALRTRAARDQAMFVWWGSAVECVSALARRERERLLEPDEAQTAFERLAMLTERWQEIEPSEAVREIASRLLRVHPLRAADAPQLAAAYIAAGRRSSSMEFVCLDDRLIAAARKEGFVVIDANVAT